jgi:hypothetical protein
MPYSIRKLPNQDLYRVYNKQTKAVHSYSTTLANAKKQVTLLNMVDAGVPLKKQGKGGGQAVDRPTTPPINYNEEYRQEQYRKAQPARDAEAARLAEIERVRIEAEAEARTRALIRKLKTAKKKYIKAFNNDDDDDDIEVNRALNEYLKLRTEAGITDPKDADFPINPNKPNEMEDIEGKGISGSGTNTSRQVAPEPDPEPTNEEASAMRKSQRKTRAKAMSPAERQKLLRRNIFSDEGYIKNLTGDRQEIFKKYNVPDKAALIRLRISSPENLNDAELGRSIEEMTKINKQLADINKRLVGYRAEITGGKEGAGISQTEKLKIAETIRPISKEDAVESYTELDNLKTIPPTTSRKGNEFVDYFTFLERLETKGNKGISFWEFWKDKNVYMKKQYVKNLLSYLDKGGKKDLAKDLYKVFGVYFGAPMIFKPVIAMSVYAKFKPTSVLDFTMGWGGRLVGAAALDIPNYIGIDLNKNLEKPYREMEKTLKELGTNTNIKLIFKDALKVDYSKLNYDMVFTSPPYYNVELYRGTNKMTEEEWNEKFYIPIFTKTWKYLKSGGHYILNVPSSVYENVLVKLLGKADKLIPLGNKRSIAKKLKQTEYTEYMYVWNKTGKKGGSIETDRFEEDGIVSLPKFRSVKINLPTYMYKKLPDINGKPPPYKYKLVVPITSSRNISSRKQETSLDINQKPVSKPNVVIAESEEQPNINDFSPADKVKIQNYYDKVIENEDENPDEIDKDEYEIKPRGKPLPCSSTFKKSRAKESVKKPDAPSVKAIVANIEGKSKAKTFKLTDEQLTDLFLEDEDAFTLYNNNLEEFKKKYKGKYGKKYGFGLGNPLLGKVEQKIISGKSNMANSWITYVKEYASKNGMSYRDALRDPKCKAGYTKVGSGTGNVMANPFKTKIGIVPTDVEVKPSGRNPAGARVAPSTTKVTNVINPLNKRQRGAKVIDRRMEAQIAAVKRIGSGVINEMGNQRLVAMSYNDSELGANAGRKFISL